MTSQPFALCLAAPARCRAVVGLLAVSLWSMLATGCMKPQVRAQREEESDRERYPLKVVGDVCTFSNATPIPISGIGLVEGLAGTGAPAPAGSARDALEHELRKQRDTNVQSLLGSNETSMVLVSALIPPGARKGDKLDLEITLPSGSRTTSLKGGKLRRCVLYNYAYAGQLSADYANSGATLRGHPWALAGGNVVAGLAGGNEAEALKKGRIASGGVCTSERPFSITMKPAHQQAVVSGNVANRINAAFQGSEFGAPREIASAKSNVLVQLNMPLQYKLNPQRFLRVIRLVPLESTEQPPADATVKRLPYRAQLEEDLFDPARSVVAALRLEALGVDSAAAFKRGLQSEHPLVRFSSAEALAYLGNASCADELARVVRQQPYLRAYALTALASLDEAPCRDRLFDLLTSDLDDETRYGAFRALRALDERDEIVRGEFLGEAFWLHQVAPKSEKPLIHVSLTRRPEVVLFGNEHKLVPPLSLQSGSFAITASEGDSRCTISQVNLEDESESGDVSRVRCALTLTDVLRTLAKQGVSYVEVIDLLKQAEDGRALSCRIRQDALPQAVTVQQLARVAREEATGQVARADQVQIIKPDKEMGGTPELYQPTNQKRNLTQEAARTLLREPGAKGGKATVQLDD